MIRRIKVFLINRKIDKIEARYMKNGFMFSGTEAELARLFQERNRLDSNS